MIYIPFSVQYADWKSPSPIFHIAQSFGRLFSETHEFRCEFHLLIKDDAVV